MCGVVGIISSRPVNQEIYDALTVLQHRGQDSAGIMTDNNGVLCLRKSNGLVNESKVLVSRSDILQPITKEFVALNEFQMVINFGS